jgi:hypothetical protein
MDNKATITRFDKRRERVEVQDWKLEETRQRPVEADEKTQTERLEVGMGQSVFLVI